MVFVGFRYVQIWIFLCSFSPTCLVVEKISIRQKKKFFWATEWALKYRGPTGPVEPAGPGGAGLGPAKKIRLLSGRVWVLGPDPRVGPGYEKTRPEPDPLPFLSVSITTHFLAFSLSIGFVILAMSIRIQSQGRNEAINIIRRQQCAP